MTPSTLETLCFRITARCNLACSFCRAGSSPAAADYADVAAFQRFVADAQDGLGLRHVSISGGEPGIDKRLAPLVAWLAERDLHVTVTTNGTSRVSEKLEAVSQAYPDRLRVRVSLDGDRSLHDALRGDGMHTVAMKEARRLKETFGWLGINTIIGPHFVQHGLDAASVLQDLRVDEWALITPVPQGSAQGRVWSPEAILPPMVDLRNATQAAGFPGRVVIWNFLGTPHTSILVTAQNQIVLSGVSGGDDEPLGSLTAYDLDAIRRVIDEATHRHPRAHFQWRHWGQHDRHQK